MIGEDESSDDRLVIPQWSLKGHQSNNWTTASVPLNIRTSPFQIELRITEGIDGAADVEIDDIYFTDCGRFVVLLIFILCLKLIDCTF